jgi:galactose-6-phosphate isomerase
MPLLDVTRVLFSSMLMDTFNVIRRPALVSEDGRVEQGPDLHIRFESVPGVVQINGKLMANGENATERPPQYGTGRKSLLICTTFRIFSQVDGFLPDLVEWRGDTFIVETLEDFTNYGAGFVQAYVTSWDLQDAPPEGGEDELGITPGIVAGQLQRGTDGRPIGRLPASVDSGPDGARPHAGTPLVAA